MNHPLLCTGNVTSLIGLMQTCSRQFVRMALLNIVTKLTVLAARLVQAWIHSRSVQGRTAHQAHLRHLRKCKTAGLRL